MNVEIKSMFAIQSIAEKLADFSKVDRERILSEVNQKLREVDEAERKCREQSNISHHLQKPKQPKPINHFPRVRPRGRKPPKWTGPRVLTTVWPPCDAYGHTYGLDDT